MFTMKVFCDSGSCKFNLNGECRTSAVSVRDGGCLTFRPSGSEERDNDPVTFWGHLAATPEEADRE
jgi:hypothetical protein